MFSRAEFIRRLVGARPLVREELPSYTPPWWPGWVPQSGVSDQASQQAISASPGWDQLPWWSLLRFLGAFLASRRNPQVGTPPEPVPQPLPEVWLSGYDFSRIFDMIRKWG